jgi:ligand-binding sensor domain-containing protein
VSHYTTADGLLSNRIEVIQEDKSGFLYFSTPLGVSKFDGHQFVTLKENPVPGTWTLQADDLWFKDFSFNGTVLRYDGLQLQRLKMPTVDVVDAWLMNNKGVSSPYAVYSIYKDTKGNVWFGTGAAGVLRYNGSRFDWITEADVNELHNGPSNGVRSMVEDSEGQFWFNTAYRYDVYGAPVSAKTFYDRTKSIGSLDGVDPDFNEFMSIVRDDEGHLWMATYRAGVYRYTGKMIIHYPIQDKGEDVTAFCIYKDRYDGLWVGTHEHGVFKFKGDRFVRFVPE